jgi:hypothetical protein
MCIPCGRESFRDDIAQVHQIIESLLQCIIRAVVFYFRPFISFEVL